MSGIAKEITEVIQGKLVTFDDIVEPINKYRKTGGLGHGLSTGWACLDEYLTLQKGNMMVVTGIPSSGKSEFIDQMMLQTIALHDWHWTVFSPENFPFESHFQKLSEKWTGKPMLESFGMGMMTQGDVDQAISDLSQSISMIEPPKDDMTIDPILDLVDRSTGENHTDVFLLDPWNELEHNRPSGMNESEYIGRTLTKLRNFGRRRNILTIIVAHPTKLQKDDDGIFPVPTPYSISGSANWWNKPDICMSIWRNHAKNDGVVEAYVQKVRNKNLGTLGCAALHWMRPNGLFLEQQTEWKDSSSFAIKNRVV